VIPPELFQQVGRFLGAGVLATACHWLLLVLLVEVSLLRPAVASCVGYLFAAALNYALRRRFVFRSRASHRRTMPRYLSVLTVGLGLNGGIMQLGSGVLALPYSAVQIAATGMVFAWNFMAHRLWTFREAEQRVVAGAAAVAPQGPLAGWRSRSAAHEARALQALPSGTSPG
jgi:putative flippase GtrA